MTKREYIKYQGIKFYFHPYHKDYLASRCGKILSLKWNKKRILKLHSNCWGYLVFNFYKNNKKKKYFVHRFVFETFKGEIPKGMHTDHVDNDKKNNLINNLQLLSPKENHHKSNCKEVVSLNLETNEKRIFVSLKQTAEYHQISDRAVGCNCQKKTKITKSKKDGMRYQFFYFKN